ncbi:MAG TPA: methyltransferase domain-containing protein [Candidatus Binatia bacterium]|nr:methyltransferase domain-containing protein [Candidatus Binatia bacterium]
MRRQEWTFFGTAVFAIGTAVALFRGELVWTAGLAVLTLVMAAATRLWSRKDPEPMPYLVRWILFLPRPYQSPKQLRRMLGPCPGERILEVGPGIGVHALPVALALAPTGRLAVIDVQQEMLADVNQRAIRARVTNIVAIRGDARTLPYADETFDAAYLISVLGEVPDQDVALRELHRVLKPDGRLVVGEVIVDPDFIPTAELQRRAGDARFRFQRRAGSGFAYLALFART